MAEKTETLLYRGTIRAKFSEAAHRYWVNDEPVTGVTTYLGIIDKSKGLLPWAVNKTISYVMENIDVFVRGDQKDINEILYGAKNAADEARDKAADYGTQIHAWVDAHVKGLDPIMPDDPKVIQGVVAFLDWTKTVQFESVHSEKVVYSKKHKYIGTLDSIARINGVLHLLDLKSGNAIYAEAFAQTAAYAEAYCEETGDRMMPRAILRLSKENETEYNARMATKFKDGFPPYQPFEIVYRGTEKQKKDFNGFIAAKKLFTWCKENKI